MTETLSPQMREQTEKVQKVYEILKPLVGEKFTVQLANAKSWEIINSLTAEDECLRGSFVRDGRCADYECPACHPDNKTAEDEPKCCGCGKLYEQFGLDTVLPNGQWELLHAKEESLLCANCIVDRASEIKGCTVAHMILEIAPPREE